MDNVPPFGVRAFFIFLAIAFGFRFLLTPEDFGMWVILWAGYMISFAGVNAWRGRAALGALASTAAFAAIGLTDPPALAETLTIAWLMALAAAGCLSVVKARTNGTARLGQRNKDENQLVTVAAKPRPTDASAADVLAHFGLENGERQ